MDASLDQDDEDFFDSQLSSAQTVRLSHLNNKSSVLCPKSQNITSQYLALQQLDAHQKMIARAKGIVDTFAPQSLQSYISVVGQQKKKLWRKSPSQSKSSELKETFNAVSHSSSRPQPFLSDETFESYHGEDSEEDSKEEEKDFHNPPEDVETQINMKTSSERNFNLNDRLHDYLIHQNRVKFESNGKKESPNRNDEDKYLEFLSKVTEHILRSGVYSDRAIQQAFDFHMQFYQEDDNKDKLQLLLNQVMEGMKISSSDSEEIPCNKSSPFLSRPNTPPVKELPGIFPFTARNDESTEEYPPSISSQAQNVEDLLSDPHLLSDSGISIRQTDS
ncbi:uncharacterized protein [Parasteatoda tepidariorum]|uniref:uncharacterized protein isoform X3 n=1 Tax=Parasteatoda tepidariorum TaxID=114398 RepID=UPI001C71C86A|nr:uncharacterized protein LOC107451830 isoform X3 [Parasteatoda tepidariorum]